MIVHANQAGIAWPSPLDQFADAGHDAVTTWD
jgi:hypothetical protein